MTAKQKVGLGVLVVALLGTAAGLSFARTRDRGVEVRLEELEKRDLVESITASGNIRARRTVSISSDVSARVSEVAVEEGDDVVSGQVLCSGSTPRSWRPPWRGRSRRSARPRRRSRTSARTSCVRSGTTTASSRCGHETPCS
jgi:hypothetical protein